MAADADALSFLRNRRTVRDFDEGPIPAETIDTLLATATSAPSAHNSQPWRFVVVEHGARRSGLAHAMGRRWRDDLRSLGETEQAIDAQVGRSRQRIEAAPALVVLCCDGDAMPTAGSARHDALERVMATQSVALAGGTLLLACEALGLNAGWLCAPLFAPDEARAVLEIPEAWEPQALILIGRARALGPRPPRRPVESVTAWR